ncbi:LysR family transcriptional regulator [Pseudomonas sp. NPDC090592]|uniref:helix-turn-helix domain-containing protein n=1 Tax=Pseudomonas sp. NPDC090592 TaxID=3364480 RepID=UPI00383A87E7
MTTVAFHEHREPAGLHRSGRQRQLPKAAERLRITQSSVSARINALEERLNRPLFNLDRDTESR